MTIAFDASSRGDGTTTFSWTHTPVGTPKGVMVFVVQNGGTVDASLTVTYGSLSLTKQNTVEDSVGERGACYGFSAGASVPTGPQTVTVTTTDANAKMGVCITVTAASDTQLAGGGSGTASGDQANPSVIIGSISGASYAAAGLFSGRNTIASVSAGTGQTMRRQRDYGSRTGHVESSTSEQASGSQEVGFTALSDDVAMVAIAIEQTVPDSGVSIPVVQHHRQQQGASP